MFIPCHSKYNEESGMHEAVLKLSVHPSIPQFGYAVIRPGRIKWFPATPWGYIVHWSMKAKPDS